MNRINIKGDIIELEGFDKLEKRVTFAFYPRGISIFFKEQESDGKSYYINAIIENHIIHNILLLEMLKQRIMHGNTFLLSSNSYIQILMND